MNATRNQRMLEMYRDEGLSQQDIADEFGVSESRVNQILKKLGYTGASRQAEKDARKRKLLEAAAERKRKVRELRESAVRRMWLEGRSTAVIGVALGIDPSIVGRTAKRLGLRQRRRGGWGSSREVGSAFVPDPPPVPDPDLAALRELSPEAFVEEDARRCRCGAERAVRCLCGRVRCEEHAVMTVDGPRCDTCITAWQQAS